MLHWNNRKLLAVLSGGLRLLAIFALLSAAGCATLTFEEVRKGFTGDPFDGLYIEKVPFFPQDAHMCGPAALSSIISFYGDEAKYIEVANTIYRADIAGTLPLDMVLFAKERGYEFEYYRGSLDDMKKKLRAATPLILFVDLGYDIYPVGHYMVAVGYSETSGAAIVYSGTKKDMVISYDDLEEQWKKTGYSTLLLKKKQAPTEPAATPANAATGVQGASSPQSAPQAGGR